MALIEVKRLGDGSTNTFTSAEIGTGIVENWVTENDANADGLVRFLNQSAETGNALSPRLDRFPKIVENGTLITDGNSNPTVQWDSRDDGYELDFGNTTISSSSTQTTEFTISIDNLKGAPQTIADSDGLRVWERDGRIFSTVYDPDTSWENLSNAPPNVQGFTSYRGNQYIISANDQTVYRFDESNDSFVDVAPNDTIETLDKAGMIVYDGDLWSVNANPTDPVFKLYDGNSWSDNTVTSPVSGSIAVTGFVPYKGDLYVVYRGGSQNAGGVMRWDGSTWENDFFTPADIESVVGKDISSSGIDVDMFGAGVWRDKIFLPLFSSGESGEGDRILSYDPQNGWQVFHVFSNDETGNFPTFISVANPYNDKIYTPDTAKYNAFSFDNDDPAFSDDKLEWFVDELYYQAGMKTYDDDLYVGHWFSWAFDGNVDGVYRWDGENFQVDLQTDGGPWKALGIHRGELWAAHRYIAGEVYRKGNGAEVSLPYDDTKNEITVATAATENALTLKVDDTRTTTTHDVPYKNTGRFRVGLSRGAAHSDQHAGADEVLRGSVRDVRHYDALTSDAGSAIFGNSSASISIFYETPTSIEGDASFSTPVTANEYRVLASTSQSGPFDTVVKSVTDPSQEQISWTHSNLQSSQTYYYKFRVFNDSGSTKESSVVSGFTEYTQPSAPTVSIFSTTSTSISGTITPNDPDIFYDKLEVYSSTSPGGPYTKFTEFTNVNSQQAWTHTNLMTGTTYYYVGKAVKTAGPVDSPFSSEVSATAVSIVTEDFESYALGDTVSQISSPFNFTAGSNWFIDDEHSRVGSQSLRSEDIGDSSSTIATIEESPSNRQQILVNWGADSEGDFDEAQISKNGTNYNTISGQNVDSQEIFSLPASTTTSVSVEYIKDFSVSSFSDSAWIHYLETAPVLSPEFSTSLSGAQLEVTQNVRGTDQEGDFNGFNVYVDGVQANSTPVSRGGTYTTSTLDPGNRSIGVTNVRSDGTESSPTTQTVSVPTITVPQSLSANFDANAVEVSLSWSTNDPDISHYNVYRSQTSGSNFSEISSTDVTSKSYVDDTVSTDQTYYYKVSSVDGGGTESALSSEIEISTSQFELQEGFESGNLNNWNVNNSDFEIKTNNVFQGTNSAGIDASFNFTYLYATYPMSSAAQISEMTFHYYETSSQPGSGVRLYNSNGNQELGIATNNPQWVFAPTDNDTDIVQVFDGTDDPNGGGNNVYQTWHRVNLVFDWGVPEVTWEWENTGDNITKTGTQPIQQGVDVDFVELHQFKGFGGEAWATSGSPDAAMWYDEISIKL